MVGRVVLVVLAAAVVLAVVPASQNVKSMNQVSAVEMEFGTRWAICLVKARMVSLVSLVTRVCLVARFICRVSLVRCLLVLVKILL